MENSDKAVTYRTLEQAPRYALAIFRFASVPRKTGRECSVSSEKTPPFDSLQFFPASHLHLSVLATVMLLSPFPLQTQDGALPGPSL